MDKIIKFIRIDDGEEFTLNEDGKTYSSEFMKREFPKSLTHKHSKEALTGSHFRPVYSKE
jgi:hypothetical protein